MAHLIATIAVRLVERFGFFIATIEKAALRRWKNQASVSTLPYHSKP
jgi:hypothetical protein